MKMSEVGWDRNTLDLEARNLPPGHNSDSCKFSLFAGQSCTKFSTRSVSAFKLPRPTLAQEATFFITNTHRCQDWPQVSPQGLPVSAPQPRVPFTPGLHKGMHPPNPTLAGWSIPSFSLSSGSFPQIGYDPWIIALFPPTYSTNLSSLVFFKSGRLIASIFFPSIPYNLTSLYDSDGMSFRVPRSFNNADAPVSWLNWADLQPSHQGFKFPRWVYCAAKFESLPLQVSPITRHCSRGLSVVTCASFKAHCPWFWDTTTPAAHHRLLPAGGWSQW